MESTYLYGFKPVSGGYGSFCVVPEEYWIAHGTTMDKYMRDNDIVDQLESLGFYEVMQNTFEYNARSISKSDVIEKLSTLGCMKHSKELESYLNYRED